MSKDLEEFITEGITKHKSKAGQPHGEHRCGATSKEGYRKPRSDLWRQMQDRDCTIMGPKQRNNYGRQQSNYGSKRIDLDSTRISQSGRGINYGNIQGDYWSASKTPDRTLANRRDK